MPLNVMSVYLALEIEILAFVAKIVALITMKVQNGLVYCPL